VTTFVQNGHIFAAIRGRSADAVEDLFRRQTAGGED
jgi:hypothetical protein